MMPNEPMALDLYAVADLLDGFCDGADLLSGRPDQMRRVAEYLRAMAAGRIMDMDASPSRGGLWGEHEHAN